MSLAAALVLVAAAAQAGPADAPRLPDRGAQVETARVGATILRAAVIANGVLVSSRRADAPHSQRQSGHGFVNYLFE